MATVMENNNALAAAFAEFNAHSARLDGAYEALARETAHLNNALVTAQGERLAELEARERAAARLAEIIEALPALVVITNAAGCVTDCNALALVTFGESLPGEQWSDVCQRRLAADMLDGNEVCLDNERWFACSQRQLRDGGRLIQLTDVSKERVRREHRQRQERLEMLGEMSARLAHQIRTPLATAMLYASQKTPRKDVADSILPRLQEMRLMIDDLLRFARGTPAQQQCVRTTELLQEAHDSSLALFESRHDVQLTIESNNYRVYVNRSAVVGALANLIVNAAQHSPAGGHIVLQDHISPSGEVCISVSDEGEGIATDRQQQIFDPFFTTRPDGTGLGLAVVKSVAEAHGGRVRLCADQTGSTFTMVLPGEQRDEFPRADDAIQFAISEAASSAPFTHSEVQHAQA